MLLAPPVNMQTSSCIRRSGSRVFYLRGVAPARAYLDKITGKTIAPVTTGQIYWGAIPFVVIQVIMVGTYSVPGPGTGQSGQSTVDPSGIELRSPRRTTSASRSSAKATFTDFGTKPADPETAQ